MRKNMICSFLILVQLFFVHVSSANAEKAWVWIGESSTPLPNYQYNSSGAQNTYQKTGVGKYRVFMPGLTKPGGGTVHVSGYRDNKHCKPVRWSPRNGGREILVYCYSPQGQLADGKFTLLYINAPEVEDNGVAYVYAEQQSASNYVPQRKYQWNKSGKSNTVRRLDRGHYRVQFPMSGEQFVTGGTMMVSAYGADAAHCQAGDWLGLKGVVEANVYCFDTSGARFDTKFTAIFINDPSLGRNVSSSGSSYPHQGTYLWANGQSLEREYRPINRYQSKDSDHRVLRVRQGLYEVRLKRVNVDSKSGVFVTAVGPDPVYCSVNRWVAWQDEGQVPAEAGTKVLVSCFNGSGAPVDAQFTLLFQSDKQQLSYISSPLTAENPNEDFIRQKVFYGTDRADQGPSANVKERYGAQRGPATEISYGVASVSIPHNHQMGELEAPDWISSWFVPEDPTNHVVLLELDALSRSDFLQRVRNAAQNSSSANEALIFVHGYNVSFEDAARRTAQLTYDLQFRGPALFFSWPSNKDLVDYTTDEDNVEWAVPHIRDFIKAVIRDTGVDRVHLIAHSMGTRGLTRALREQRDGLTEADYAKINNILLAAPDIDVEVFVRDIVPEFRNRARVTVYASDNDNALHAANWVARRTPRAGITGFIKPILPDGLELIDATGLSIDWTEDAIAHSYYGDNRSIISDMRLILQGITNNSDRCHLMEMNNGERPYWYFNDGTC
ncbi:MAG: alpha/beta hydrolase [Methyloligellaceae bacterium]